MGLIDFEVLSAIDLEAFRGREPYPWVNPHGALTKDGYEALAASTPELELFDASFGKQRKYGQVPHDRYALSYRPDLSLAAVWHELMDEIQGPRYREFVCELLGSHRFRLVCHWHYASRGCSVSPHCDAKRKIGSHIFYLNRSSEWDQSWGGETLVLDDGGRFHSDSAPDFGDFDALAAARTGDNDSFIFARRGNSWHGVRELTCPEGHFRKVFIVVFEYANLLDRARAWLFPKHRPPRT